MIALWEGFNLLHDIIIRYHNGDMYSFLPPPPSLSIGSKTKVRSPSSMNTIVSATALDRVKLVWRNRIDWTINRQTGIIGATMGSIIINIYTQWKSFTSTSNRLLSKHRDSVYSKWPISMPVELARLTPSHYNHPHYNHSTAFCVSALVFILFYFSGDFIKTGSFCSAKFSL